MKNLKTFALSALSLFGFAACQQVEIAPDVTPEATHTVTFVAGAPETKTTVNIDGTTAKFKWTADDINRITLYENGVPATETKGALTDGLMTIKATFDGSATEGENTYIAVVNSSNDLQIMYGEAYDESTDILVSKAVSSFDGVNGVQLKFRREVAIAKMTLKGLDANEEINSITVSSNATIANKYTVNGWSKEETDAKTELKVVSEYSMGEEAGHKITANTSGEAVVWFTCIPQDGATLTVKVEAADGDTYTKTFGKPISLTRGDVTSFGVAMVKDDLSLSFDFKTHPSGWPTSKTDASSAANYVYSLNGVDYTFSCPKEAYCGGTSETSGYLLIPSPSAMGLPALSGYKLTKVVGTLNDSGTPSTASSISITDGENVVAGGTAQTWSKKGAKYTYSLTDTEESQVYYFTVSNKNCQMIKLVLTYEPAKARTNLATPTNLAVSAEKVVSWDAVAGAASYVLTIGTQKYPCPSNSYDASAIADEYYDVAVVAVPSDTEKYKNSAAATLTGAKFGTPKLPTPTISAGVLKETSVAFSWTKDARATNGYHWALYNGETLVQEATETSKTSTEVTGLTFGTTYTAKVYALAVDGDKPYVQSLTASFDLTTKAKTTISTIVAAGTGNTEYSIADLTVMAVSGSNFVVKDETGLMFCYMSGAKAGDVVTLAGTYEDYQGLKEFKATTYTKATTASVDYGTATELNSSNVAAYVENPVVQYVKAKATVAADGSLKVGNVAVYQYGTPLTSYAGLKINLYGYTLGYNTTKSNIVLLQTSVEIDQTVPYLSVDPTSKTWASTETDAAVFTVTTNTEGVKDWSVSPTTLDWATVAVDKNAGTITVTPKDKNTTDTAREATLTVTHSAGTLSETITLTQSEAGAVKINNFSQTYSYGKLTNWSLTNYTDKSSYYLVPSGENPSVATISGIFTNKTIQSDVVITLNVATFGSGTNPSASTFSIYADSDLNTSVTATQSGTLPTSSTYTNAVYTVTKEKATALISDLAIKITKPGRQIRLKSIKIEFSYTATEGKNPTQQ